MTFFFDTQGLSSNSFQELTHDALSYSKKMETAGIATGPTPFQEAHFGFGTTYFDSNAQLRAAYVELAVPSYWNGLMG